MTSQSLGAQLLKRWRGERKQFRVAYECGVDFSAWSALECGRRKPGTMLAKRIAEGTDGAVPVESWDKPARKSVRRAA